MAVIDVREVSQELSPWHYEQLEAGSILLFPVMPLEFPEDDYQFLLHQRQTEASYHKNIAYRPAQGILTGVAKGTNRDRLGTILHNYSQHVLQVVRRLLPRYAEKTRLDFTSYRPFEEQGRKLPLHSRNDLLHVDSFPTRPTNGDRILRFFTNLNPQRSRVWITSDPFPALASAFAEEAGLLKAARHEPFHFRQLLGGLGAIARLRGLTRSRYDTLMHRFHNFLKESRKFQETWPQTRVEFPPKSSWLVFTDMVSHAVVAGQFALEQTFIVSRQAMLRPDQAPLNVLERLTGVRLAGNP